VLKHALLAERGAAERSARPAERQYYEAGRAADAEADDSSRKTPTEPVQRFSRGAVQHADLRVRVTVALHLRRVEHVRKRLGVDFPATIAWRGERIRGVDLAGPEHDGAAIIDSRAEPCPIERDDAPIGLRDKARVPVVERAIKPLGVARGLEQCCLLDVRHRRPADLDSDVRPERRDRPSQIVVVDVVEAETSPKRPSEPKDKGACDATVDLHLGAEARRFQPLSDALLRHASGTKNRCGLAAPG
jgi:hypothetical protein